MSFANKYISRFKVLHQIISNPISTDIQIRIVIPCFNEKNIVETLLSIYNCDIPKAKVEVIIVINYSEACSDSVKEFNKNTCSEIQTFSSQYSNKHIQYIPIIITDIPIKEAGVGYARKIGLDEAVQRFNAENNPYGILVCLDADSLVAKNYITEIEQFFIHNPKITVANIHFEHPLHGDLLTEQYNAIAQYELHLRYYVQQLRKIGFPFAYHTVGSSCCVRADAYCRQGGMNKRQAGEDFYFLQKLMQAENFGEITSTCVYPSARISDRVPFGTGFAMTQLMNSSDLQYYTYNPESFIVLQNFFELIPEMYSTQDLYAIYCKLHMSLQAYCDYQEFQKKILEIQNNTTNLALFTKRFFLWFNGFQVFKYLNFAHNHYFSKMSVIDVMHTIEHENEDVFIYLKKYRNIQKK